MTNGDKTISSKLEKGNEVITRAFLVVSTSLNNLRRKISTRAHSVAQSDERGDVPGWWPQLDSEKGHHRNLWKTNGRSGAKRSNKNIGQSRKILIRALYHHLTQLHYSSIDYLYLVVRLHHWNPGGPGFGERFRIVDREFIHERIGTSAREAFG